MGPDLELDHATPVEYGIWVLALAGREDEQCDDGSHPEVYCAWLGYSKHKHILILLSLAVSRPSSCTVATEQHAGVT